MSTIRSWLWICMLLAGGQCALAQPIAEADAKAAFIFNFVGFTDWPADASKDGTALVVCVSARSTLRSPLASLDGHAVRSRTFRTRVQASIDDVDQCQVVVVDASDRPRIPTLLRAIAARAVLTIGDGSDLHRDGLAVSLAVEQNRLRFRVNLQASKNAQLEISSKLLRLAQVVE